MAGTTKAQGEALEVRRTFAAPPARVFQAWTRPEELKRWAAPGPMETPLAEVDLRVGGQYRIHMRAPDGAEHRVFGVYREVDPPRRLVYTWTWEDDPEVIDSVVTVEFHDRGGSTEVVLRHEALPNKDRRDKHEVGWNGCLDKLASVVSPGR
jgi:uncharacterized protein YndB with AHSA1/START domain